MIDKEKFEKVIERISELEKEYYGGMEVSFLENKVREVEVSSNKIYNYMSKGYIKFEVINGKKRVSKEEVVKYLRKCFEMKNEGIKKEFEDIF